MALPTIDWTEESARYDEAHLRLVEMGRLVSLMPSRRVLDIGCSTAKLKQVYRGGRARRLLRSMDRRYLDAGSRQARRDAEQFIILASAR